MATISKRLDWLWFLGYGLEDEISNHSVLSMVSVRRRVKVFKEFFECVVWQCVKEGLVDGTKLFIDSSLIDPNASNNSVIDTHNLSKYLRKGYRDLEGCLNDLKGA